MAERDGDARHQAPGQGQDQGDEAANPAFGAGHHGEFALEGLACTPQERFHRGDTDPLVLRDRLVGPAGSLAQPEHPLVARRELGERGGHHLRVGLADERVLGVVMGDVGRLELGVVHGCLAPATALDVDALVGGDHRQPRVEAPLAGEVGERPPRLRERLLGSVLRLVLVAEALEAEPEEPAVVAPVEDVEGGRITGLAPFDELTIPPDVHVAVAGFADVHQAIGNHTDKVDVVASERHVPVLPVPATRRRSLR
ncbi:MAG: hypothetical protein M0013_08715 [Actinomycetota bacterium]|nr:hypothetical protein [Actinomycetota bacterium]